jgi:hypothetical protein
VLALGWAFAFPHLISARSSYDLSVAGIGVVGVAINGMIAVITALGLGLLVSALLAGRAPGDDAGAIGAGGSVPYGSHVAGQPVAYGPPPPSGSAT